MTLSTPDASNHGARPIIISKSVTGTETERETSESWIPPIRAPTPIEVKQMLAMVISQAVALVMRSHVYTNSDIIWQQLFGGAIGTFVPPVRLQNL